MTTPCCVLCGRPEDEATPSFSTYLHGVDSRCPECGKPQGADLVDRAAVEGELEDFDRLKDLILTLLPYTLDDGEDPPNEANAEECVEYAADEIARLRSKNAALRAAMTEAACLRARVAELEGLLREARKEVDAGIRARELLDGGGSHIERAKIIRHEITRALASTPQAKADPVPVAPPSPIEPAERRIVGGGEE